ncbi:dodecin family protein [Fodinibius sp. AD559]|uniref:dodecin family protein n=1 Tax=Fodinibius sp. AD559 TaxID=3424179 RepID=UPI004046E9C7
MSLAKVIEVLGEGKTIEEAVENVRKEASKTIENIKNIYIKDIQAKVENNKLASYRVNAKVTFVLEDNG